MSSPPESRTSRSAKNVSSSLLAQSAAIIMGFAARTVFIATLGIDMLGVNALLISVLSLLALADLGLSSALMYVLYDPIEKEDFQTTASVLRAAKRLYLGIASIVIMVGLCMLPYIDNLIQLDRPVPGLTVFYLVLLADTAIAYLMQSRVVLLQADQRIHIVKIVTLSANVVKSCFQIGALLIWESYLSFILLQALGTLMTNVALYIRAGRIYPWLREKASPLVPEIRSKLIRSVQAMLIIRVSGLVLANCVPIVLSLRIGTRDLGMYSNYMLIISSVVMILEVIFAALTPSLGSLLASNSSQVRARGVFDELLVLGLGLHGATSLAIALLVPDFVHVWLGESFQLDGNVLGVMVISFYVTGSLMPLWAFRGVTGLFQTTKVVTVFTAVAGVVLSYVLGGAFGMAGVILGPVVGRLLISSWLEPSLLIRRYLAGTVSAYFSRQIWSVTVWGGMCFIALRWGDVMPGSAWVSLLLKVCVLVLVLPVLVWLLYGRSGAGRALQRRVRSVLFGRLQTATSGSDGS